MSLDTGSPARTELLWVGDGGWCVCDAARDDDDPHRVLAFARCHDHIVDLAWVRTPRPPERFETLREALLAVERAAGPL